tara:strand:+ start:1508 stop:1723 length:216 start_codon:yes stop_codon:yes gene_type:complete
MAIVDFKRQIRQAFIDSGFRPNEDIVEKIDILLDDTVPNSIWNRIAIITLRNQAIEAQLKLSEMEKKYSGS